MTSTICHVPLRSLIYLYVALEYVASVFSAFSLVKRRN